MLFAPGELCPFLIVSTVPLLLGSHNWFIFLTTAFSICYCYLFFNCWSPCQTINSRKDRTIFFSFLPSYFIPKAFQTIKSKLPHEKSFIFSLMKDELFLLPKANPSNHVSPNSLLPYLETKLLIISSFYCIFYLCLSVGSFQCLFFFFKNFIVVVKYA